MSNHLGGSSGVAKKSERYSYRRKKIDVEIEAYLSRCASTVRLYPSSSTNFPAQKNV